MGAWATGERDHLLAGLQNVPEALYESAELDGRAGGESSPHYLPILTPTIFFNLIMGMISTFQYFTQAFVISRGSSTSRQAVQAQRCFTPFTVPERLFLPAHGYAAAMAWLLFIVI